MNTAAPRPCQTRDRQFRVGWLRALLLVLTLAICRLEAAEPPPWQRELDAARLAEATATFLRSSNPAAAAETDRRVDELYRQLVAKYPDEAPVRRAAGDHYGRVERPADALAEWRAAQKLDPTNAETAHLLGGAYLSGGNTRAAREQFQRAVDARPGVAVYHFDLANVLFVFRHEFPDEETVLREALGHYRTACELAPGSLEFARGYAETFYGLPKPDWPAAFAAWEHVLALSGDDPDLPNSHLARISLGMDKPEQAESFLALIRNPRFAPVIGQLRQQAERMKQKAVASPP